MHFRKVLILISVLVITNSCSDLLKSNKEQEKSLEFEDARLSCLDSSTDTLKQFDRHSTDPDQIITSLKCYQTSLEYFNSKTKASLDNPDNYTTDNLRKFFGKYLGDDSRVSESLADQMMLLKSALLGGSDSSMSRSELQNLISLMQMVQVEVAKLKPYWKMLLVADQSETVTSEMITSAQKQLLESFGHILRKTQLSKSDYSFNDLRNLVYEIEMFAEKSAQPSQNVKSWLDLVENTKKVLFGENVDMGSLAKWNEALRMVSEIHRFYMIYSYQFNNVDMFSKPGIESGDEMLVLSLKLLDSSWVIKTTEIPFSVTEAFFKSLYEKKLLPDNITAAGIDETYRAIVTRVLERESSNSAETVIGLDRKHLTTLKTEYEVWKSTQNFIDLFPEKFNYEEFQKKLSEYKIKTDNHFSVPNPKLIREAWNDWKFHMNQKIPLLYTTEGQLKLVSRPQDIKEWPWYSLARLNVMRTLARSLMLGYGVNRTSFVVNEKLNEQSLTSWYADYGKLGVEIKAFDPRSGNSGPRSFFEANLFTMAGNGDGFNDRQEVFEFINIIFSSGLSGLTKIQNHMTEMKCDLPKIDIMGNAWIINDCFKVQLRKNFSNFFSNLDGLSNSVAKMSDQNWNDFYAELLSFSKNPENNPNELETSDLRTMVVILHYIESMYIHFDLDRDDRLSKEELIQASSRFVGFFKTMFKLESDPNTLRDRFYKYAVSQGFACMVLTGQMPALSSCSKVFLQDAWENRYSDRLRILKTLNQLKAQ